MDNLTIRLCNWFIPYNKIVGMQFNINVDKKKIEYSLLINTVKDNFEFTFCNEEDYNNAKKKLEEGLINNYVFIDLLS